MADNKPLSQLPSSLALNEFPEKGLYLIFGDSSVLSLTAREVEDVTRRFWGDPSRISLKVRGC